APKPAASKPVAMKAAAPKAPGAKKPATKAAAPRRSVPPRSDRRLGSTNADASTKVPSKRRSDRSGVGAVEPAAPGSGPAAEAIPLPHVPLLPPTEADTPAAGSAPEEAPE